MSHRLRVQARPWLMLAPALAVILLLFAGGLLIGFGQSIDYMPALGRTQPTPAHYVAILTDRTFYVSLGLTLYVAVTATVLSTVLALVVGMVLRERFAGSRWITFIYQLPLPVPHLVAAAGIVMLITQSGLFARVLFFLGAIQQPADFPVLVFDRANVATILVYVWKETPFIGLVILAVLNGVGHEYDEVARTLGANAWQRFRHVLLPLLMPGILSTSVIVFAFMFGSFEVPLLLGQRYPNVLPVTTYRAYVDPDLSRRPEAMAMGMIITLIVVLLLWAYRRLLQRPGSAEATATADGAAVAPSLAARDAERGEAP